MTAAEPRAVQLRAVLEALAPDTDADKLTRLANALALHGQLYRAAGPAAARRGTVPALRSLERVHRAMSSLADAVDDLGADESLILERQVDHGPFSLTVLNSLSAWNDRVLEAHRELSAGPELPTVDHRPRKPEAQMIARRCARLFHALTGKPATIVTKDGVARGPFLAFVRDVFRILEIDASPETWAKRAVKDRRPEG